MQGERVTAKSGGFRPEIQGLRAVAVGIVVLFHLWPKRLSGGYVGVDVFFVISGYLITSHILREVVRTGSLDLLTFWARRIRRLLPASLLVLAVSVLAVLALLPSTLWADSARQAGASALYIQNWILASDAVDYMAQGNVPTVAQHFWSLSVEEQFYVLWPLIVLGTTVMVVRRRGVVRERLQRALIVVLGAVGIGSLVWSIVGTASDQSLAYFITPTRIWEFVIGALLAIVPLTVSARLAPVLGWAGLLAILVTAYVYNEGTLFPGWLAAVPTLGAAAVILAGPTRQRWSVGQLLAWRPATFLGDVSYSIYLWHWPLIVVLPHALDRELRATDKLAILLVTVLLAWGTKVWVEDRFRTKGWISGTRSNAYKFALVGMAVVTAMGLGVTSGLAAREEQGREQLEAAQDSDCFGPRSLDPANGCASVIGAGPVLPALDVVVNQNTVAVYPGCQQGIRIPEMLRCTLGVESGADRVLALIGDSHGTHWFPAIDAIAQEQNWTVYAYTKGSCPMTGALRVLDTEQNSLAQDSCNAWMASVQADLDLHPEIEAIVTTTYSSAYEWASAPGNELANPAVDGFVQTWSGWIEDGRDVYVIAAIPRTNGQKVPDCLAAAADPIECAVPRTEALPADPMLAAADAVGEGVQVINLSDQFCDATTCYPVVGDLVVYRDRSHLTAEYARELVPYLAAGLGLPAADEG